MDDSLSIPGFDCLDLLQPGTLCKPLQFFKFYSFSKVSDGGYNPVLLENDSQDDAERSVLSMDLLSDEIQIELVDAASNAFSCRQDILDGSISHFV